MLTNGRKGDFEAYFTFWSGRPDPDGNVFTQSTCKGAQNDSHYCNAEVDALLTKARQVPDPAERKKLYDQATEILMRDIPRLQLWHRRVFTGYSAQGHGLHALSGRHHSLARAEAELRSRRWRSTSRGGWRCWCRRCSSCRC